MSVIVSVVMATIGASPAYAVPDRTNEFSHKVSVIDTTINPQTVTATAAMGTKPVGVAIAPVQLPPTCDLKITKDMSPNPLMSGQSATVTLTVANVGTGLCLGRITRPPFPPFPLLGGTFLSDTKPPGLTFTSPPVATPAAGWSCSLPSGNASCGNLTALPSGYTVTFTINATVTAPSGTVTNCARISNSFDTNPANNESCVERTVVPRQPTCDLKITKAMSPNSLVSGQPATVTLTVANMGVGQCPGRLVLPFPIFPPPPLGGTFLSDTKPPGLTFTSPPVATPAAGWSCSLPSGNASCVNLTALPSGYTVTFTINATVTAPSGTVTNCARISNSFDTNPANNESCVTKQVV